MENPIKMDDLGGYPYFRKHPYYILCQVVISLPPSLPLDPCYVSDLLRLKTMYSDSQICQKHR